MSNHSYHHGKHRRRNPIVVFFDRLMGRKRQRSESRSSFPGISLPKDYDPANRQKEKTDEKPPISPDNNDIVDERKDFPQSTPDNLSQFEETRPGSTSSRKNRSIFSSFDLYFKQRELRREERFKEKLRRRHHRKSQEEYRKTNAGPGLVEQLLNLQDDEAAKERKIPAFSHRNPFYRNLTIVVNSILIFLITYTLVYLFYWLTSMMVASLYGIDSTLYFYDLKFNNHSPLWSRFNILLVTGIPPFFCLFLGIFLYQVIFKIKRFAGLQKLFILWSAFHLFNHFFGAFPSGIITDEGFGYVAAWMYMNTAFKFMFALISLFGLGVIGYNSAKHILESSESLHRIKSNHRLSFILFQVALPWLIGTSIMLLIRNPHNFDYPYETLMFFSMVFLVIPPFFNKKVKPELNLLRVKKRRTINLGYLAMMILLLAFLRIVLGIGLHFLIEINISISPAWT